MMVLVPVELAHLAVLAAAVLALKVILTLAYMAVVMADLAEDGALMDLAAHLDLKEVVAYLEHRTWDQVQVVARQVLLFQEILI
jgi:hypothetical protein